jgi:inner membrane protein involved in colicin E2 resistance
MEAVMKVTRLLGILFIYVSTAIAWFALGGTLMTRSGEYDSRLGAEVAQLWGGRHQQVAPVVEIERPRQVVENVVERQSNGETTTRQVTKTVVERAILPLASSRIDVALDLDQRRKGLLWYDTYAVVFRAQYRTANPDSEHRRLLTSFSFPSREGIYDDFVFKVNGQEAPPARDLSRNLTAETMLAPGAEGVIEVTYRSRGMNDWTYAFSKDGVAQVRDFTLNMKTNFAAVDFPAGTISPHEKTREGTGWHLTWRFASLAAGQKIGVDAPNRLNPGPVAARITFFAPVSLLFFLTVMVVLGVLSGRGLHPVHYFFLSAAFFAFHLLLAYLVDHLDLNASFAIASATSLFLVLSYLRLVTGVRAALRQAGLAQLIFLVLFSYAFFFEGYTGLTVTIGAIVTLFALMQLTARVDWNQVFAQPRETNGRPAAR